LLACTKISQGLHEDISALCTVVTK